MQVCCNILVTGFQLVQLAAQFVWEKTSLVCIRSDWTIGSFKWFTDMSKLTMRDLLTVYFLYRRISRRQHLTSLPENVIKNRVICTFQIFSSLLLFHYEESKLLLSSQNEKHHSHLNDNRNKSARAIWLIQQVEGYYGSLQLHCFCSIIQW